MFDSPILLDGAMGTQLSAAGMPMGISSDVFGYQHPETAFQIHLAYLKSGSRVIYTNTFCSNRLKLKDSGLTPEEVIAANVRTARKAADSITEKALVAMDIGPMGVMLEPLGDYSFEEAYDCYREMAVAGEKAGADIIVIETFTDLQDARCALLAAKENTRLPVWVTMSFEKDGHTFTGTSVASVALTLTGLGADVLGINCSLGPRQLLPLLREMSRWTSLPLIIKPNAGLPDPATGKYDLAPQDFADAMMSFLDLGVMAMGGCCGTSPAYIQALSDALQGRNVMAAMLAPSEKSSRANGFCSSSTAMPFGPVHVVGERLNPTGKKLLKKAYREQNMDYVCSLAVQQSEAGAHIININCGLPDIDEADTLNKCVMAVQTAVSLPIMLDSTNPAALEQALRHYAGKAIINSVNGSEDSMNAILPLVKKYGAAVVALCTDDQGVPETCEQRLAIARRIVARAESMGICRDDILVDTLTMTVSAQQAQAMETLKAMRMVRAELGVHGALGVSNISFGLPERQQLTGCFLAQALLAGLDFPIINPNIQAVMDIVTSHRVLSGEDIGAADYIARFAVSTEDRESISKTSSASTPSRKSEPDIVESICKGLKSEAAAQAEKMLAEMDTQTLIESYLVPALDKVGKDYESGRTFLPQLINASNAASGVFELIKARLAATGADGTSRGKILVATVKGDVHNIGKNIAKALLENYGYTVIDLGHDVPKELIVETAIQEDIKLIGLSALMTTTVVSMKETIEAIHSSGHPCKVYVGGAVLTESYAMEIGADYYAKDAQASVRIAAEVFGNVH